MQYFGNILVKISQNNNKMDIFRIYIERAIEKDGISRPLGSREIPKTKVCTVLRDTLYLQKYNSCFFFSIPAMF